MIVGVHVLLHLPVGNYGAIGYDMLMAQGSGRKAQGQKDFNLNVFCPVP